ncbi:hypothetical protein [Carboxylicivirga sp. RSCT41]|uniref:hypothetical protein n=1 Tax=Carboxylicivirga agarovorans TaxID=3417570 RepID=UPI003D32DB4D
MRIAVLLITFLVISTVLAAQGTEWMKPERDYREALELARNQNKPACFVIYADWSRQSELLLNNLLVSDQVADFYNRHFINVKINVGELSGRNFLSHYNVRSIPAIVFVSSNGQLLRVTNNKGLNNSKALLKAARLALNFPGEKEWSYYRHKYEAGQRDWNFLEHYIEERQIETGLPTPYKLILEYINALPSTAINTREDVRYLIYHHAHLNNELYSLLKTNPHAFVELNNVETSIPVFTSILHRNRHQFKHCTDGCKKQLRNDFGALVYPALEYYELTHLLHSAKAAAFIDEYFSFITKYDLPPSYNHRILMVVLQTDKVKKQQIVQLIDELNTYAEQHEPSIILQAIRVRLLVKAGYKRKAVVSAQNSVLGIDNLPRSKAEEHSYSYLQQVANGYVNESFSRLMQYLK